MIWYWIVAIVGATLGVFLMACCALAGRADEKSTGVELSEFEIELIKRGLSDHISDYCVDDGEEKPYQDLLDKLNTVRAEK